MSNYQNSKHISTKISNSNKLGTHPTSKDILIPITFIKQTPTPNRGTIERQTYFWNRIYTWLVVREAFGLLAKFIKGYLVPWQYHNIGKRRITYHVWKAYFFFQKSGYKLSSFWYHCMAEHIYNFITAMGALAMFTFQLDNSLRSKHFLHPVAIMGVVDSFEPSFFSNFH